METILWGIIFALTGSLFIQIRQNIILNNTNKDLIELIDIKDETIFDSLDEIKIKNLRLERTMADFMNLDDDYENLKCDFDELEKDIERLEDKCDELQHEIDELIEENYELDTLNRDLQESQGGICH